jgi:RNA polymerase sigma-70 factor (ECF subfamily)
METTLTQGILVGEDHDAALVRRMADGDELALAELYARHGRRLYVYALRLTGSESRAEDVVQESLVAAWKAARSFRSQSRSRRAS